LQFSLQTASPETFGYTLVRLLSEVTQLFQNFLTVIWLMDCRFVNLISPHLTVCLRKQSIIIEGLRRMWNEVPCSGSSRCFASRRRRIVGITKWKGFAAVNFETISLYVSFEVFTPLKIEVVEFSGMVAPRGAVVGNQHFRGWGYEFFSSPPRPDRLWGTPSLISSG